MHAVGPFGQAHLSPAQEGVMGLGNGTCHLGWCHLRVGIDGFPRRGVDGLYGHGGPPGLRAVWCTAHGSCRFM